MSVQIDKWSTHTFAATKQQEMVSHPGYWRPYTLVREGVDALEEARRDAAMTPCLYETVILGDAERATVEWREDGVLIDYRCYIRGGDTAPRVLA